MTEAEGNYLDRLRAIDLPQLNLVGPLVGKADTADGEHHLRRQLLVALETAGGHCITHRLLDFALRGDADFFQELAQAGVEDVFVHDDLLMLWPNRIIEHLFAAIMLIERTGKGRERAMANGVVLGTKLKPAHHQRPQSIARPNAGEAMTNIGRSYSSAIA